MRYCGAYYSTRKQGIFQVDVSIEESLIHLRDVRLVQVLYRDHTYTLTHFQDECQKIHQWFNVWGLTENDYKIDKPKRRRHDTLIRTDGTIRVKVMVDNWEFSPHIQYVAW